jgi:uncharacterized protein YbjT (DUF2867 family)
VGGVDVLVHCASSPTKTRQIDVEGTERLLRVAVQEGVSHFVFISIVGVDRNPYFPYYRMKLEVERTIERSVVPYTILRATQFHEFVLRIIQFLDRLPVMMMPKGFLLQPIDTGEVADRLVELALSRPVGRASDVGGPEVRTAAEFARAYFMAAGRRRRVVEVPVPGKMAWGWREGALLCPDHRYGKIRWEEFLTQTMQRRAEEARREDPDEPRTRSVPGTSKRPPDRSVDLGSDGPRT